VNKPRNAYAREHFVQPSLLPASRKTYIMHHAKGCLVSNRIWEAGFLQPKSEYVGWNSLSFWMGSMNSGKHQTAFLGL
jgi:hypothetical protein